MNRRSATNYERRTTEHYEYYGAPTTHDLAKAGIIFSFWARYVGAIFGTEFPPEAHFLPTRQHPTGNMPNIDGGLEVCHFHILPLRYLRPGSCRREAGARYAVLGEIFIFFYIFLGKF